MKAVKANNRLVQLDGMRGLAILMVMCFHYTTRYHQLFGQHPRLPFSFPWGTYGVQLFFITSGFVIFMTLERTQNYMDFLVSRFARLYPPYWAAVIITFLVVWRFPLPGRGVSVSEMLINLSMLQAWFQVPPVDGVYWTLSLELAFYASMLVLFLLGGLRRINIAAAIWLVVMVVVVSAGRITGQQVDDTLKTSFLLEYANLFLAGIMFYKLHRQEGTRATRIILASALLVEFIIHGLTSFLLCCLFFGLFWGFTHRARLLNAVLAFRPLVYVGTVSYSLYLLHQNIGYVILRWLYARAFAPLTAIPITFALVFALAACLNILVETPARDAIRAYWKKKTSKNAELAAA